MFTEMIDLESCEDSEFKHWVLANYVPWIKPGDLRAALEWPKHFGFRLQRYDEDPLLGYNPYRILPQTALKAVYEFHPENCTTPHPDTTINETVRKIAAYFNRTINSTWLEHSLRREATRGLLPVEHCNYVRGEYIHRDVLSLELRFSVVNYGESPRADAGQFSGHVRNIQAMRAGDYPFTTRIHP